VWSATTDDGPFNGGLERPAMRTLIPRPLPGSTVLDAGCGSGAQCAWLLDQGADVIGVDLSPRMVETVAKRCGGRGRFVVADLAEPQLVTDTWRKANVEVTQQFWRRPLAATVNAFGDAGFAVDRIIETRPDPTGRDPRARRTGLADRRPQLHHLSVPAPVKAKVLRARTRVPVGDPSAGTAETTRVGAFRLAFCCRSLALLPGPAWRADPRN